MHSRLLSVPLERPAGEFVALVVRCRSREHGCVAELTAADVDQIRQYLATAREDVLEWLPGLEWSPAWKSEAAGELANTKIRRDGSRWSEQPLRWTYATAWLFISAVVDCIDAMCLCVTMDTPALVLNALSRVALEAGGQASWLLQSGLGPRRRVARRVLLHHASARQVRKTVQAVNSQRRPWPRWSTAQYPPTIQAVLKEANDLGLCWQYEQELTSRGTARTRLACEGQALPGATRLASDFAAKIRTPGAYAIWSNAVHAGWSAITADWEPDTLERTTDRESIWAVAINAVACAMDPCRDALLLLGLNARLAQWNRSYIRSRHLIQHMPLPADWS